MINRIVTFVFCFLSLLWIAQEKFTFGSGTRTLVPSVRPLIG